MGRRIFSTTDDDKTKDTHRFSASVSCAFGELIAFRVPFGTILEHRDGEVGYGDATSGKLSSGLLVPPRLLIARMEIFASMPKASQIGDGFLHQGEDPQKSQQEEKKGFESKILNS